LSMRQRRQNEEQRKHEDRRSTEPHDGPPFGGLGTVGKV